MLCCGVIRHILSSNNWESFLHVTKPRQRISKYSILILGHIQALSKHAFRFHNNKFLLCIENYELLYH